MTDHLHMLLESAILDKRWAIANAERELQQFGQWSSDWSIPITESNREIERICESIDQERSQPECSL